MQKIELYVVRTFSQKLSATFEFLSENGKTLFKFLAYLLLPVSAVQALGLNTLMEGMWSVAYGQGDGDNNTLFRMATGYGLTIITLMAGTLLCVSMVYGMMSIYGKREERLTGLTMKEFRPTLLRNLLRSFLMSIAITAALVVFILAAAGIGILGDKSMLVFILCLAYIAILVVCLPISLAIPIYLMEDGITLWKALSKAIRLGFKTWGGIFAIMFIMGLISYFIQSISSVPFYLMILFKAMLISSDGAAALASSPIYTFFMYLFGVLTSFCMYIGMMMIYLALGIQYGHAAEKIDGVSVEQDVDNFESFSEKEDDEFEEF